MSGRTPPHGTALELVTVGTELLLGHTVDTNSAFLGRTLSALGIRVVRRTSVADEPAAIRDAVDDALDRTGLVLTTGGLGPTRDDITRNVVADLLGLPLEFAPSAWEFLLARYARLGRAPAESNRTQAMVPRGAVVLPNRWGTAPGLWIETARGVVIMLPGVPHEMMRLVEHEVAPRLAGRGGSAVIRSRILHTSGIPESTLAERVARVEERLAPLTLAYLPDVAGVDLRLTSWDADADSAAGMLDDGIAQLRDVAADWAWGTDDDTLAGVVIDLARARAERIAVAESCTGGMIGARLTDIAGSSAVFAGGVTAYADEVKQSHLGVPAGLLQAHGAVSAEVAASMAAGVAERMHATLAVSVTGIAGPGGGSDEKPVGTVWFAVAHRGTVDTTRVVFAGTRPEIRARAATWGLMLMWRHLRDAG